MYIKQHVQAHQPHSQILSYPATNNLSISFSRTCNKQTCLNLRQPGRIFRASVGPSITFSKQPTLSAMAPCATQMTWLSTIVSLTDGGMCYEQPSYLYLNLLAPDGIRTIQPSARRISSAERPTRSSVRKRPGFTITLRAPNRSRTIGRSRGQTRAPQLLLFRPTVSGFQIPLAYLYRTE